MTVLDSLRAHQVLQGRGKQRTLVQLCHAGRLVGGLSISLRATPDEVVGPLCAAMGGAAATLRVIDVSTSRPLKLDVQFAAPKDPLREDAAATRTESWEVDDVAALAHNLNDLYRDERAVKLLAVLGEWEDMLQLWALERRVLRALLEDGVLDAARNRATLERLLDG